MQPKESQHWLLEAKDTLFSNWETAQREAGSWREDLMSKEDQQRQNREFFDTFIKAASANGDGTAESAAFLPLQSFLSEASISRAKQGFSPRDTATYVFSLKDAMFSGLQKHYADDAPGLTKELIRYSKLMDSLGLSTFESYSKGREEVIRRQQEEILEISTPVTKLWDGILALPLIGTLDSHRTQVIMESLLQEISRTGYKIAILDISGVLTVDTLVTQHLLKTVAAARLMGAECIISGIRPQTAQTMVHLGVDLSSVKTKSSLAGALELALSILQLSIVKKAA
jgi:rsbT co-antagonist protein RsbR